MNGTAFAVRVLFVRVSGDDEEVREGGEGGGVFLVLLWGEGGLAGRGRGSSRAGMGGRKRRREGGEEEGRTAQRLNRCDARRWNVGDEIEIGRAHV